MSASQDRIKARAKRAEEEKNTAKATTTTVKKLQVPQLGGTGTASTSTASKNYAPASSGYNISALGAGNYGAGKTTAKKLQVPQLAKTGSTQTSTAAKKLQVPQLNTARKNYAPTASRYNISALGAGDYSGSGKLQERAAKAVSSGVLGTASGLVEIAAQATPTGGEQSLGQFSGFGDLGRAVRESKTTGEDINTITKRIEQQRSQKRKADRENIYGAADRLSQRSAELAEQAKEGTGALGGFLVDLGVTGTQMVGDAVVNTLLPGSGMAAMGARVYGQSAGDARREGKTETQQAAAGLKSAAIEILTEKLFGGLAKAYGVGTADELVEKMADKLTKTDTGKRVVTWLINSGGEGIEEVLSDIANPVADRVLGLDSGEGAIFTADDVAQMGYDFLLGAAMGAIGGAGQLRAPQITKTGNVKTGAEQAEGSTATTATAGQKTPSVRFEGAGQGEYTPAAQTGAESATGAALQMPTLEKGIVRKTTVTEGAGLVRNDYTRALAETDYQTADTLNRMGKALGVKIEFTDSLRGGAANGEYDAGTNTIRLAADAENPVQTVTAHELTHRVQELAPTEYETYRKAAASWYVEQYGAEGLTALTERYRQVGQENGVTLDEEGALDELAADFTERLLEDGDLFARFAADHRSAAQKLLDALREFLVRVRAAFTGDGRDAAAQRTYGRSFGELEQIAQKWQAAYDAAARVQSENTAAETGSGARYSIRSLEDGRKYVQADRQVIFGNDPRAWSEQLEDYINGKIRRGQNVQLIAEDGDILTLSAKSAGKLSSMYDNGGRTMSADAFGRKVSAAAHIDELAKVSRRGNRSSIDEGGRHGEMAENGWNYRTAYFRDFDGTYYRVKISVAQGANGNVVYNIGDMQERSAPQIDGSSGKPGALGGNASQKSAMSGNADVSTATPTIRSNGENVNRKFSLKGARATDSTGKPLSAQQQEYFKDSKVRDREGRLRVLYHGTGADFNIFDRNRINSNFGINGGDLGFYFTPYQEDASSYARNGSGNKSGKVVEAYLNLKNPLIVEDEGWGSAVRQADLRNGDLSRWAKDGGHDGIIVKSTDEIDVDGEADAVYIAFSPEQIKRTDNTAPTEDADIRYSLKGSREYEQELRENGDRNRQAYWQMPNEYVPAVQTETEAVPEQTAPTAETEQQVREWLKSAPKTDETGRALTEEERLQWAQEAQRTLEERQRRMREETQQRRAQEAAARAKRDEEGKAIPQTLQAVGVAPFASEADYAGAEALAENVSQNERSRRRMRKEMEKVSATEKERLLARQVAGGQLDMEDVPGTVDRDTVARLADFYRTMDSGAETELLRQKRNTILEREEAKMRPLLGMDVAYDEGGLRESGKQSGTVARTFSTLRRNLQTPARICATEWGAEHGKQVYETLFYPVTENNGRQVAWVNEMLDKVRTFKDSAGKERALNKTERAVVQELVERRASEERVARFDEQYAPAVENVKRGQSAGDAAREFGITERMPEYEDLRHYETYLSALAVAREQADVDMAAVDAAVETYSELYGELYKAINTFLAAHGYKPIGFIEGYAPHLQPEETKTAFSKAMKLLGLDDTAMMLPTSISGQTADLKPYKQYDPFFQTRHGDKTEYDIAKGFESYVYYLGNIFYHTDDIMRLRTAARYMRKTYSSEEASEVIGWAEGARDFSNEQIEDFLRMNGIIGKDTQLSGEDARGRLEDYISELYEQVDNVTRYSEMVKYLDNYANRLAGKQNMADRGAEAATGRGSLNWINSMTGKFGGAKLAFNVSSALNQTAQLPMVAVENGEANTVKAVRDFFKREQAEAFVQSSNFLKGKKGIQWLLGAETGWEKFKEAGFVMTEAVDSLTAFTAVRSRYLKEIKAGKSHAEAMRAADEYGRNVMGSRARGEKPMLFDTKNPFWQIVTRFQLEAMNSWEHISRDVPKEIQQIAREQGKATAARALAWRAGRYAVYAFLANWGIGLLSGGSPVPYDVIGSIMEAVGAATGVTKSEAILRLLDDVLEAVFDERLFGTEAPDEDEETDLWAAFESLFGNAANDVPVVGRVAALAGIGDQTLPVTDLSKIGDFVSSAKNNGLFTTETLDKALTAGGEFAFGGNQLRKSVQGVMAVAKGGVYDSKGRLKYEVAQTPLKAAQGALFGRNALKEAQEYYAGSDTSGKFTATASRLTEAKNEGDETAEVVSRWWNTQQSALTEINKEIKKAGSAKERKALESEAAAIREDALKTRSSYASVAEKCLAQGMDTDEAYREANRECFGAETALKAYNKEVYERAQDAQRHGVSYDDFYDYYFGTKDIEATEGMSVTAWKFEYLHNSGMEAGTQAKLWLTCMASDSAILEWMELESSAGITLEQYYTYKRLSVDCTKKADKLDAINALDLTTEQKNALYFANDWAESKLYEAPWYTGKSAGRREAPTLTENRRPAPVLGETYKYFTEKSNRPAPTLGEKYEYAGMERRTKQVYRPAPVLGEVYKYW